MNKKFKFPKKQALKQIEAFFLEAKLAFKKDTAKANKCVDKARKIGMKSKVRIPAMLQRQFCKYCYTYLRQGVNCRVRNQNKKMVYYCFSCKRFMRFPIKKK
jgi:ribonuclease P protein subunit RPR2